MKKIKLSSVLLMLLNQIVLSESIDEGININQIQFVGSHNSYKQAMPDGFVKQLMKVNPEVMESLEYEHIQEDKYLQLLLLPHTHQGLARLVGQ